VHLPDHVYEADAVPLGTDEGADDPEDDGESVVDAGGGAGACGAAGDVPPGDVDDGDDADATLDGGGWSSGSSASPSTTDDECPYDARTCSSDSSTSQSDEEGGFDGSTPVTDSDEEYESDCWFCTRPSIPEIAVGGLARTGFRRRSTSWLAVL